VGDVEVDKSSTTDNGATELKAAINGSALDITGGTITGADPFDLPLVHDTQGGVGNTSVMTTDAAGATLTQFAGGVDGNLNAASTSQVVPFAEAIPAGSIILAAAVQVDALVAGGSISAAIADVGVPGTGDLYISAENVFAGLGFKQASPGVAFSGLSGAAVEPVAVIPEVTVSTTSDDVEAADVGDITVTLWIASPPAA